jgi:hypothetical protein
LSYAKSSANKINAMLVSFVSAAWHRD